MLREDVCDSGGGRGGSGCRVEEDVDKDDRWLPFVKVESAMEMATD